MMLSLAAGQAARHCIKITASRATHASRAFVSLPHDVDDKLPRQKNAFGGRFDWEDPLNFKSLLTEDEVSFV
jgi:hypothetical protein